MKPISKFLGLILVFFSFGDLYGQSLGVYQNYTIPQIGGNAIIQPSVPPSGITKSSVKVSGHFRGEVYIDPVTGKIHVNNAYPNGDYKVDVFAQNGLKTSFTLTVAGTECRAGKFLYNENLFNIPSKSSRVYDINRDNKSDLVLISGGSRFLQLLINSSTGLVVGGSIDIGFIPEAFDIGDLNNDGIVDVALTDSINNGVSILYGQGLGQFSTPVQLNVIANLTNGPISLVDPRQIKIEDINSDGFSDLIILSPTQGTLFVGLGNSANTFDFSHSILLSQEPSIVVGNFKVADLNNNGTLEIVVAFQGDINIFIIDLVSTEINKVSKISTNYLGGCCAFFMPPLIQIFDFNSDSKLDIYFQYHFEAATGLLLGQGNNSFMSSPSDLPLIYYESDAGGLSEIIDLNGDEKVDFLFGQYTDVKFGSGVSNGADFKRINSFNTRLPNALDNSFEISVLDVNSDNLLDVFISDNLSSKSVMILGTLDYLEYTPKSIDFFSTDIPANVISVDLNGDKLNDFIVGSDVDFHVYKQGNDGWYNLYRSYQTLAFGQNHVMSAMELDDLDKNGRNDLVIANGSAIIVYKDVGQGDFEPINVKLNDLLIKKIKVKDFNSDGHTDIIALDDLKILFYRGRGNFVFDNPIISNLQNQYNGLSGFEEVDINKDGSFDLVLSDSISGRVGIYVGSSIGRFSQLTSILIPGIFGFSIDEFNGDELLDLVVAVKNQGIILYSGSLQNGFIQTKILKSVNPFYFNSIDLNNDRIKDIVYYSSDGSIHICYFDKNTGQIHEQLTNMDWLPVLPSTTPGLIYFGDIGNSFSNTMDGNTDVILWRKDPQTGFIQFLINQTIKPSIFSNRSKLYEFSICNEQHESIHIAPTNFNSIAWEYSRNGNQYANILQLAGYSIVNNTGLSNGFYRAKLANTDLCGTSNFIYTDPIKIQTSSLVGLNPLLDNLSTCDSVLNIAIQPALGNYQWSNGSIANEFTLSNSGNISLRITDSIGCSVIDSATVSISNIRIIENDTTVCKNTEIKLHVDSLELKNNIYLNDLKNGLIFYASMDSNSIDLTGNFPQKTDNNLSYGLDRHRNTYGAASFSNNSSIVYDYRSIINQSSYTLSAWINLEQVGSIINLGRIGFFANSGGLIDSFNIETNLSNGIDYPWILEYGNWHHIVATYDSLTSVHSLYVNGKNYENRSFSNLFDSGISTLNLGVGITGRIDDVSVWNRALTEYEISVIANNNYTVEWSDGQIGNSITVFPDSTTKYFAKITNGNTVCYDSVLVRINSIDTALQISSPLPKCFLDTVTITAFKGFTYEWFKNDSLLLSATLNTISTIDSGIYKVLIRDVDGCVDSSSTIDVRNITIASSFSVNDTTQLLSRNSFVFSNGSSVGVGGFSHSWDFGDGANSTVFSPVHVYDSVGVYRVKLLSTSYQGCSDSSYVDISVISDLDAAFVVNDSVQCLIGNHFEFRDTSTVNGSKVIYHWDFGDGSTSNIQHPTYIYQQPGFYEVKLKISELFGGIDSTIIRLRVDSMPVVDFSVNDTLQCLVGNSFNFLNRSIDSNGGIYSYLWKFGDGDSSVLTSPSHVYKSSGTFNIILLGKDINGCFDSSSINVNVFSSPSVAFNVNDTIQPFASNRFIFNNLSDTTSASVYRYSWYFGDGSNSSDFSPIHMYDSAGEYRVKLKVVSDIGCSDSTSMDVKIFSVLKIGFAVNDTVQCLVGNLFKFRDSSFVDGGSMTYRWEFGDGNIAAVKNPTYIYSLPGVYNVKLVVKGTFGGLDSSIVRVRVASSPVVAFIVNDTLQCLSVNRFIFSNISVSTAGESNSYKWYFGDGDTSNLSSTTHIYRLSGNYAVRLIGTNINGCSDTTGLNVRVLDPPMAGFTVNDSVQCLSGNRFVLKNSTIRNGNGLQYSWDFGDGNISREESPVHIYEKSGSFVINLISVNSSGCSDTVDVKVIVFPKPISKFNLNDSLQCITTNIFRFIDSTKVPVGEKYSLQWNFGDGTGSFFQNPIHTYKLPGSYFVKLISSVSEGCTDSSSVKVTIAEPPPFLKYDPVDVVSGISTKLQARQIGVKYQWFPSIGLSSPSIFDPFVILKNEQRYVIKITTDAKCDVYDSLLVRVFNKYDIFVPQGFTPNNDGKNDLLFPFLVGIKSLKVFKIFDRWGNLVYSNSNVDRNNGWNGTLNGKNLPLGVYIWVSEGIDLDNNLIRRSGNVALIR